MSSDRRDAFYKVTGARKTPVTPNPQSSDNLSGAAFVGILCASSAFCGMVAGYALHEGKLPQAIARIEKVWRFVDRCPEKAPRPDARRFLPDTIPRTNPDGAALLTAPNYVGKEHKRGRHYEWKGYSRGRPRNADKPHSSSGGFVAR